MKFGGTSVADRAAIERLMAIVRAHRQADAQQEGGDARGPIVVVSALSGVTDRLLGVAAQAGAGDIDGALASLHDLHQRHVTVSEVVTDEPCGPRCSMRSRPSPVSRAGPAPRVSQARLADGHHRGRRRDPERPPGLNAQGRRPPWTRLSVVTDGEHRPRRPQFPGDDGGADDPPRCWATAFR
jgi:hypothetical protein